MKEIDKNLSREELRVEMCRLQDEAFKYRQAIDRIDKKVNEEKYQKLLNRCFLKDNYYYLRVERYNEDYQLYGTSLYLFDDNYNESTINIAASIWEDELENAKEITNKEFNQKLKEAVSHIKFIE